METLSLGIINFPIAGLVRDFSVLIYSFFQTLFLEHALFGRCTVLGRRDIQWGQTIMIFDFMAQRPV